MKNTEKSEPRPFDWDTETSEVCLSFWKRAVISTLIISGVAILTGFIVGWIVSGMLPEVAY